MGRGWGGASLQVPRDAAPRDCPRRGCESKFFHTGIGFWRTSDALPSEPRAIS